MPQERRGFQTSMPVREIEAGDASKKFYSELFNKCGTNLASLLSDNNGDRHVWVYDGGENDVLGVLLFIDNRDDFYVDVVSNNFAITNEILGMAKPGGTLYSVIESNARNFGADTVTLDSIPERIGYWKLFGFVENGEPFEGSFCMLTPMIKHL